jgi:hypothetical protein
MYPPGPFQMMDNRHRDRERDRERDRMRDRDRDEYERSRGGGGPPRRPFHRDGDRIGRIPPGDENRPG